MSNASAIDGSGKGYVRFYRKLLDSPLFRNKPAAWLKIWIFILLRVNWRESVFRPTEEEPINVPAGSLVTSLEKLGTHTGTSKEHARRCLDYLERTQSVALQRTHRYTMITVLNWATYQQTEDGVQHAEHHTGHHSEFEDATHSPPHGTPRTATPSKEVKNFNKNSMSNSPELDFGPSTDQTNPTTRSSSRKRVIDPAIRDWFESDFWPVYPRHEGKSTALAAASGKATTPEKRSYYRSRLDAQLPEYERRKRESGQRVIPLASTWFHQDRAEDELVSSARGASSQQPNSAADYPEYVPLSGTES